MQRGLSHRLVLSKPHLRGRRQLHAAGLRYRPRQILRHRGRRLRPFSRLRNLRQRTILREQPMRAEWRVHSSHLQPGGRQVLRWQHGRRLWRDADLRQSVPRRVVVPEPFVRGRTVVHEGHVQSRRWPVLRRHGGGWMWRLNQLHRRLPERLRLPEQSMRWRIRLRGEILHQSGRQLLRHRGRWLRPFASVQHRLRPRQGVFRQRLQG